MARPTQTWRGNGACVSLRGGEGPFHKVITVQAIGDARLFNRKHSVQRGLVSVSPLKSRKQRSPRQLVQATLNSRKGHRCLGTSANTQGTDT